MLPREQGLGGHGGTDGVVMGVGGHVVAGRIGVAMGWWDRGGRGMDGSGQGVAGVARGWLDWGGCGMDEGGQRVGRMALGRSLAPLTPWPPGSD